ncbi:hypothetical protein [Actinoplanes palleronii]|nr:hypothetical protein [Actinoplanes palleronii]
MDNVYTSSVPTGVVADAGDAGANTEWDAATLDDAISWLNATGKWLHDLSFGMVDIKELMGGAEGGKSPMGTFPWAQELSRLHSTLYSNTEAQIKQLSKNLYEAATALQNVKDNYDRAEERNALNATDMQQIFADAARRPQA